MKRFNQGDTVRWKTPNPNPAIGSRTLIPHEGHIFDIVPAGKLPEEVNPLCIGLANKRAPRTQESYVVYEHTKLYWPNPSILS